MSKYRDGLAHDEQAHPVAVVWTVFRKCKGVEDTRHPVFSYTDPGVTDFDTNTVAGTTAAYENVTSWVCVFHRVVDEIAENSTQEQRVALNRGGSRNDPKPDSLL